MSVHDQIEENFYDADFRRLQKVDPVLARKLEQLYMEKVGWDQYNEEQQLQAEQMETMQLEMNAMQKEIDALKDILKLLRVVKPT